MQGRTTANGAPTSGPLYREEQRFRQWWLWSLVVVVAALVWWVFVEQVILGHRVGENPLPDWGAWLLMALIGVGLPLLFLSTKLVTEVTADQLVIRYRPMTRRNIPLAEIEQATARTYRPVSEYGGWGVKGWSRRNIAYNVSGNRGVQLVLKDGRRVLVGSQRAEELAQVIESQRGAR
jgi:hypothetical protein